MTQNVKRQERGWASHFIGSRWCMFRRNTLLEYNDISLVVSSVGRMWKDTPSGIEFVTIGYNRYFETVVFHADSTKFKDADVERDCEGIYHEYLEGVSPDNEILANETHEQVVKMMIQKLLNNEIE